jgi:hypothetical protein
MVWALLQLVLLAAAGIALWLIWRRFVVPLRVGVIVTLGFLARAVSAQVLFWISYLHLAIAPSLQRGGGIWFFGVDAFYYFPPAERAANTGLRNVFTIDPTAPSVVYVKTLSLFAWMFGAVPSVALLLNLFAYLGTVVLIIAWGRRANVDDRVVAIPLVAISFAPTWILWSLQPLKDSFFIFLVVLCAFALYSWIVDTEEGAMRKALVDGFILLLTIYLIAGIRWYFPLIILASAFLPMFVSALRPPGTVPRIARVAATILIFAVSTQLIIAGAGPYLPDTIRALLRPGTGRSEQPNEITDVVVTLENSRKNLDYYKDAGTRIGGGKLVLTANEREHDRARKIQAANKLRPVQKRPASPGTSGAPETAGPDSGQRDIIVPESRAGRLIVGLAALYLPRFIATHLGLVSIGGGRGFWWFAEADTLLFIALVIVTVTLAFRTRRMGGWRHPITWCIVTAAVLCTVALAYTISNFGTLLRHREMIAIFLALLPLVRLSPEPTVAPAKRKDDVFVRRASGEHSLPSA